MAPDNIADHKPIDDALRRFQAGDAPANEAEREWFNDWAHLAADDRANAFEARDLEDAHERYEGPLSWSAFAAERQRDELLARIGIDEVNIPAPYVKALGSDRTEQLRGRIKDAVLGLVTRDGGISADPDRVGKIGRALDFGLGAEVVRLEDERKTLVEDAVEALRADDHTLSDKLLDAARGLDEKLGALEGRTGHPDRFLRESGDRLAQELAARTLSDRDQSVSIAQTRQSTADALEMPDAQRESIRAEVADGIDFF